MRRTFVLIVPLLLAGATNLFGDVAYLHTGTLWGGNSTAASREAAMNTVFGSGNWSDLDFAAVVNSSSIFNSTNTFIFLDGSNNGANALQSYLTSNLGLIEDWVRNGGHLFLNSAPNQGNGMSFGFGVSLNYPLSSNVATAVDPSHFIFNGPYGETGSSFTGSAFSHATVSGVGLNPLITGTAGTILAEMNYGSGHVLFGGMTAAYHQGPQPNVDYLWANIIAYGVSPSPIPETSSYALIAGIATLGFVATRRRR